jgi:hypothetical protein
MKIIITSYFLPLLLVNLCELNNYGLFVNAFTGLLNSELMKKKSVLIRILAVVLFTNFLFINVLTAQTPQQFKYQALLRDASGNIIASQAKTIVVDILKDSTNGPSVFTETHNTTTNAFGIINLNIGSVNTTDIASIDWANHTYFLKMTVGGVVMGTSQLLSVPYALYAKTAENGFSGNYNDLTNKPVIDGSETKVTAGTNVTLTGTGTTGNPYEINATGSAGGFAHYVGELWGGGVIVSVWKVSGVEHGIIATLKDLDSSTIWSNIDTTIIGSTAQNPFDGQANTNAIISQVGHIKSAAKLCGDYINTNTGTGVYSDWYLPAIGELNLCYNASIIVNMVLGTNNGFGTDFYWSSTEYKRSGSLVWTSEFIISSPGTWFKNQTARVRAVRKF